VSRRSAPAIKVEIVNPDLVEVDLKTATLAEIQAAERKRLARKEKE